MRILVFRSASMERFDALAEKLGLNRGYAGEVEVLTHPHAAPALKANYPSVKVIEYPHKGGFSISGVERLVREGTLGKEYGQVIVLCGNLRGGGHFNVLRCARRLGGKVFLFNAASEMTGFSPETLQREALRRICLFPVSVFGTILLLILGVPWFTVCLMMGAWGRKTIGEKTD